MIFHENRLLADDSYEISYLCFRTLGKMVQNLSSAAVMIGALRLYVTVQIVNNKSDQTGFIQNLRQIC